MTHTTNCTCNECLPFEVEERVTQDYTSEWEEACKIADLALQRDRDSLPF